MQKISDTTTYRRLKLICRHVFLHFWEYPLLNRLLLLLLLLWFLSDDNFVVFRFLISLIRVVGTELCLIGLLDKSYVLWWITIWFFFYHTCTCFYSKIHIYLLCVFPDVHKLLEKWTDSTINKQTKNTNNKHFFLWRINKFAFNLDETIQPNVKQIKKTAIFVWQIELIIKWLYYLKTLSRAAVSAIFFRIFQLFKLLKRKKIIKFD